MQQSYEKPAQEMRRLFLFEFYFLHANIICRYSLALK